MTRERDSQRGKLYRCEGVLRHAGETHESVQDVEKFLRYVWSLKRVRDAFPKATSWDPPGIHHGGGRQNAAADSFRLFLPKWARRTNIILHELAHTITRREYGLGVAGHGWQFCAAYLSLVLYVMGRESHNLLKKSMKAHRVRFKEPRQKKPMDPERRVRMAVILASARAKRKEKNQDETGCETG
jgi:putative metallohydrolase (TIGR04338 family)